MKKLQAALLAAGLIAAGSAQASIISHEAWNDHETTDIEQSLSFAQFDASLGSLTSVTLNLLGESISSTILENRAANGQTFRYTSELEFTFNLAGLDNVIDLPDPAFTTTLATTNGSTSLGHGESLDLGTTVDNGVFSLILTSAADLALFTGGDHFSVNCSTLSISSFAGGGGNIDTNQTTTGACGAEIVYTYSTPTAEVSEPWSLWLFGAGLFSFAAMRRFS
ncbi:choice-of-anchor E domain-containing protein [Alkalimonas delamerensis]|uniref:Choice-of-anchor E domain-containing protein n=1 Tax=Alkalimonas delamerensis TaxID=265981 RepID=A0ABT9GT33_9GAMM|nr:choice-of-anchor E domain-containing protein [Alkalimonas delamerensis]MDP4529930.1 choice-of-anchor E domain-containing protein [Alkalimonas delamerensis]